MNSAFEHSQSLSHFSVVDGVGLKKKAKFSTALGYTVRNPDSVAERIKVTRCNRGNSVGSLFPVQYPVTPGNSPLLLGWRETLSAQGLLLDILE